MPKTPNHNAEGEEGDGEREEAEDDAPEAVQAQNQQSSNQSSTWSTYPDLLRVQRSKGRTNPVVEEHPPEGQEPGSSRAANPVPRSVPLLSQETRRDTGTVPKRLSRPPPPPDLTARRADVPRVVSSSRDGEARVERLERERVALQQQRSTDEAKEAELRHSNEVQVQLSAISASVQSLNQVILNLHQSMNERLDQLDSRLTHLVASGSTVAVDTTVPLRREIGLLIQNQRREVAQERRICLTALAEALRLAAETDVKSESSSSCPAPSGDGSKQNGPQ